MSEYVSELVSVCERECVCERESVCVCIASYSNQQLVLQYMREVHSMSHSVFVCVCVFVL